MDNAFLLSAALIFVAELGDKSQLMALAFATRYRFWPTMLGITLATLLVHAGSVAIGRIAAAAHPLGELWLGATRERNVGERTEGDEIHSARIRTEGVDQRLHAIC